MRGQTGLEYLLLIAGGVLVSAVLMVVVNSSLGAGGNEVANSSDDYAGRLHNYLSSGPVSGDDGDWVISGTNQYSGVSGNVGIGTNTPSQKLEVNGKILMSSATESSDSASIVATKGYVDSKVAGVGAASSTSTWNTSGTNQYSAVSGYVGIGTSGPGAKLHVVSNAAANAFVVGTATAANGGVVIKPEYSTNIASIQGTNSGLTAASNLAINPEGGNVGIGTTAPGAKLDIHQNVTEAMTATWHYGVLALSDESDYNSSYEPGITFVRHRDSGGDEIESAGISSYGYNLSNSGLKFYTSSSLNTLGERMRITSGGNVGIGTSSPASRLQVAGEIQMGNSGASCTSANAGAIRWDGTSFLGCTGNNWINITVSNSATGGTITDVGAYRIHTYTSTGSFTPVYPLSVDLLIVGGGGGGGGGNNGGGGGGAGGLLYYSSYSVLAQVYVVTVGAGGAGGASCNSGGANGGNSAFGSLIAVGGGAGGTPAGSIGSNGGSGGGGGAYVSGTPAGGSGTTSQGNAGGNGYATNPYNAGGGGGAGGAGSSATSSSAGAGGAGLAYSINGTSMYYAAGGGGGAYVGTPAIGGSGIGGNGGMTSSATAGAANTGSGGGGGGYPACVGGAGGSGIVIVRYLR